MWTWKRCKGRTEKVGGSEGEEGFNKTLWLCMKAAPSQVHPQVKLSERSESEGQWQNQPSAPLIHVF